MYRLLIVDDEPIIANSLFQYFMEDSGLELEVFRCYSGREALDLANRNRMDIVITDISMPVMDGIELQGRIYARWPQCKFIYLTSHDKIEYAQQAIRNGAFVDFVLKNEEDDVIHEAVVKAIKDIEHSEQNEERMSRIQRKIRQARPLLQRDYLTALLDGRQETEQTRAEKFAEWEIPIKAALPVLMFICKIDDYGEKFSSADKNLLHFALENIVAENMNHAVQSVAVHYDAYHMIWFVQPLDSTHSSRLEGPDWGGTVRFAYDSLEMIQSVSKRLLNISISIVMTETPCDWSQLPTRFMKVKNMMNHYFGLSSELLMLDNDIHFNDGGADGASQLQEQKTKQLKSKMALLENYLEAKSREPFFTILAELLTADPDMPSPMRIELNCHLQMLFISYINRMGMFHQVASRFNLDDLFRVSDQQSWKEAGKLFVQIAEYIFDANKDEIQSRVQHIVDSVNQYIEAHLEEDLSLTRIADMVYHSPTYFSKLYKKLVGVSFKDYITDKRMEKAAELLQSTNMKVKEIAVAVGYESPPYFIRAFKKYYKVTPHNYRELHPSAASIPLTNQVAET